MGKNKDFEHEYKWKDRRRYLGLPLSFTKYAVSDDRFFITKGFFKTTYDEVRLYRILDLQLTKTFGQKIFGVGTITVFSSDQAQKEFKILSVKRPKYVKELISDLVEKQRDAKRVINRELMGGPELGDIEGHPDFDDNNFDDDVDGVEEIR